MAEDNATTPPNDGASASGQEAVVSARQEQGPRNHQEDRIIGRPLPAMDEQGAARFLGNTAGTIADATAAHTSGSTFTGAVTTANGNVVTAQLGDSVAVAFIYDPSTGDVEARRLTGQHVPAQDYQSMSTSVGQKSHVVEGGGLLYLQTVDSTEGKTLKVTGAFGDSEFGAAVHKTPDITTHDFSAEHAAGKQVVVMVCSDGVIPHEAPEQAIKNAGYLLENMLDGAPIDKDSLGKFAERMTGNSQMNKDNASVAVTEAKPGQSAALAVLDGHGGDQTSQAGADIFSKAVDVEHTTARTAPAKPVAQAPAPQQSNLHKVLGELTRAHDRFYDQQSTRHLDHVALIESGVLPKNTGFQNYAMLMQDNIFLRHASRAAAAGGLDAFVAEVAKADSSFANGKVSLMAFGSSAIVLQNEQGQVMRLAEGKYSPRPDIPQCLPARSHGEMVVGGEHMHVEVLDKAPSLDQLIRRGAITQADAAQMHDAVKTALARKGYVLWDDTHPGGVPKYDNVGLNAKGEPVLLDPGAIEHIDARGQAEAAGKGFSSRLTSARIADYEKRAASTHDLGYTWGEEKAPRVANFKPGSQAGASITEKPTLTRDQAIALETALNENGCKAHRASNNSVDYAVIVDEVGALGRDQAINIQKALKAAGLDAQRTKTGEHGPYGFKVTEGAPAQPKGMIVPKTPTRNGGFINVEAIRDGISSAFDADSAVGKRINKGVGAAGGAMAGLAVFNFIDAVVKGDDTRAATSAAGLAGIATSHYAATAAEAIALRAGQKSVAAIGLKGAGVGIGVALPFFEECIKNMQEGNPLDKGDAYAATASKYMVEYRTNAALLGVGVGVVIGGPVGGAAGLVTGVAGDVVAVSAVEDMFGNPEKGTTGDPEKKKEAAELQAKLDKSVIAPKVDELFKALKDIKPEDLKKAQDYLKAQHENGSVSVVKRFEREVDNASARLERDVQEGKHFNSESAQKYIGKAHKEMHEQLAKAPDDYDGIRVTTGSKVLDAHLLQKFLQDRPVLPKDQAARDLLLAKLEAVKQVLGPIQEAMELSSYLHSAKEQKLEMSEDMTSLTQLDGSVRIISEEALKFYLQQQEADRKRAELDDLLKIPTTPGGMDAGGPIQKMPFIMPDQQVFGREELEQKMPAKLNVTDEKGNPIDFRAFELLLKHNHAMRDALEKHQSGYQPQEKPGTDGMVQPAVVRVTPPSKDEGRSH